MENVDRKTRNVPIVSKYDMWEVVKNADLIGPLGTVSVSERGLEGEKLEEHKHRVRKKVQQAVYEDERFKDGEFLIVIRDDPMRIDYDIKRNDKGEIVADTKKTVRTYSAICDVYQMKPYELEKRYRSP